MFCPLTRKQAIKACVCYKEIIGMNNIESDVFVLIETPKKKWRHNFTNFL